MSQQSQEEKKEKKKSEDKDRLSLCSLKENEIFDSLDNEFFGTAIGSIDILEEKKEEIGYEIMDTSTNGTYLNGKRIEKNKPIQLKDGDTIAIAMQRPQLKNVLIGYTFRIPGSNL